MSDLISSFKRVRVYLRIESMLRYMYDALKL